MGRVWGRNRAFGPLTVIVWGKMIKNKEKRESNLDKKIKQKV